MFQVRLDYLERYMKMGKVFICRRYKNSLRDVLSPWLLLTLHHFQNQGLHLNCSEFHWLSKIQNQNPIPVLFSYNHFNFWKTSFLNKCYITSKRYVFHDLVYLYRIFLGTCFIFILNKARPPCILMVRLPNDDDDAYAITFFSFQDVTVILKIDSHSFSFHLNIVIIIIIIFSLDYYYYSFFPLAVWMIGSKKRAS